MNSEPLSFYDRQFNYRNSTKMNRILGIVNNEIPVNTKSGFMELYVTKNFGKDVAKDAVVTIYARQGEEFHIPIERFLIVDNPTLIELPIAHRLGNLIIILQPII